MVSAVLGLIRIGVPSLWVDEAATARAVQWSYVDLFDGYHGLYYSIEKPWISLAGSSEWALRLPSVIGAMLSVGLLVVIAHRLFGGWAPLASGLLLATSPFVVKWSQQARGYTLLLAVSLLATWLLLRAVEEPRRLTWGMYGLSFAVLLVWHPVAGLLLLPAQLVLSYQHRSRILPHGLLAALLIVAIGVPWVVQIAIRSTGEAVAMNWLKAPSAEVALRALLDVSGAAGLGIVVASVGLWVLRRAGREDVAAWLGVWAFAPFAVALLVTVLRPIFLDRYLMLASPAFALLGGVAITSVRGRLQVALVPLVVVVTAVGLVRWYDEGTKGNWRGEDWRGAVQSVLDRRSEAETVVVAGWAVHPAAEYYGADVVDVSSARSIWLLHWSEDGSDISRSERRALGFGDHRLVERDQFGKRVSAQLWRRPGP